MSKKYDTPLLDELEKGPFPSFVKEIKLAAKHSDMSGDLLGHTELCFKERVTHWKHGGIVGVRGYGGGVIGRYSDIPDKFPGVAHFHTVRVNSPSGFYYTSSALKEMCDLWDKYGSGLTNMHGSTGDMVFLGARTENLEPFFAEVSSRGWDLGGSGSAMRTPSGCLGMSRCEWANIDAMAITNDITQHYQDEMHRPAFPYKFKFKVAGCPVDCIASIARADMSIIGTWKGDIRINQDEVANYAKTMDIKAEIIDMCPTGCMQFDGKTMKIDNSNCNRCMHCIAKMTKALRPGTEKGATLLLGSKAPIVTGALMSWVIVPFIKMEPPYDEFYDLVDKIWEWWDENGKNRERIGELMERLTFTRFLKDVGLDPHPAMVKEPRRDPFFFWAEEDIER
ncbi:dissimilatory-type sulfite reductase subunit alpha [Candidatus Magnetominusculus xianensis]|uniref:Dissimilatory sulfite reductase alpha subunit n=1 Tax=Candidatus Magnetominusculus xianensis TaxID=1748249 RepID=A0ABR5SIZ0_9BACT|nr:dissimilatory-type sulfite reductase subunit alpha [Candidatus Magnetominusculus xianensis]KWT91778.1 dissimilatory sulfite reductase alpha subunit [Candidatus Magnetominusculus xianensis]MBF0404846.1 dissimilatory-type sulfite reductase subunit alpha [Nitrospirota bacterium]